MTASMFGGSSETCGSMTSGGTESILLAIKAYRDFAASKGVTNPNLVLPRTAHPAFLKVGLFVIFCMFLLSTGMPILQYPRMHFHSLSL
jgi:glutamate/tyrosine decarboxylase-like PLP-dependent enzyme